MNAGRGKNGLGHNSGRYDIHSLTTRSQSKQTLQEQHEETVPSLALQ
jgi:hypothetical protein